MINNNMRKFWSFFVVWVMVLSMHALEVNNLRTQAYTNPIGIDIIVPSFSWQLSSQERSVMQTSYSIKISKERDFSDVVWESGTVESSQSADVQTSGFTPQARTRYYWQVTVTDNKGNAATSTESAYFEIGLKDATAWDRSRWIKASTNPKGSSAGESQAEIKDYTPVDQRLELGVH